MGLRKYEIEETIYKPLKEEELIILNKERRERVYIREKKREIIVSTIKVTLVFFLFLHLFHGYSKITVSQNELLALQRESGALFREKREVHKELEDKKTQTRNSEEITLLGMNYPIGEQIVRINVEIRGGN